MNKYKVTYYKDAIPIEKEIVANKFIESVGKNGELVALFTDDFGSSPGIHSAFSSVMSVEKISEGDER